MHHRSAAAARVLRTVAALGLMFSALPHASAEDYAVKELRVEVGCPGCEARTLVRWNQNGVECEAEAPRQSDARLTIDLTHRAFTSKNSRTGCILAPGVEVWARVDLPKTGISVECRSQSSPLRFTAQGGSARYELLPSGGQASCRTAGAPNTVYSAR